MYFLRRSDDTFFRNVLPPQANVALQSTAEEKDVLQHNRKVLPQRLQVPVTKLYPIEQNPSPLHIIETHEEICNCSFPGTGMAHQRNRLSRLDCKGNVLQYPVFIFISKPDVSELNPTTGPAKLQGLRRSCDGNRQVERLKNPV